LLTARRAGVAAASASPDLGPSTVDVELTVDGVVFPDGQRLMWRDVEEIDGGRRGLLRAPGWHDDEDPHLLRRVQPPL